MRREFGDWMPDLPPFKLQAGLTTATNVVPVAAGYGPFGSLSNIDSIALSAAPRGAINGKLSDGTNFFFAGTNTTLERKNESAWADVSRAAGYTQLGETRWSFAQLGNDIFASNRGNPTQVYGLTSDTVFGDVGPFCPRAAHLAVAENFLWAGDCFFSDIGVQRDAVAWSSIGNGRYWPDPNTDDATAVLSGRQILDGRGGIVNAVVSGAEVVAILQENAIWRADFVGNDIVWQFNRVESDHGCTIPGAAIDVERGVLFIAEDGFRLFDYTHSRNIGKERINDFFFSDYDRNYPDSVTMVRDPGQTRVFVSYAATDATNGVPNRILCWDYMLDRWSLIKPGTHYALLPTGSLAVSLDSPDTPTDPDLLGTGIPDTGSPGDESFDDRQPNAQRVQLGAFDSSFRLGTFTGTNLSGVLETGDLELAPGRRALLTAVRPQVDGEETNVQVAGFDRRADDTTDVDWSLEKPMESDGNCYTRIDARTHRIRFNLSPYFTEATDYDLEFQMTGRR